MGVTEQFARFALRRAHVLIVEAPGDPTLRIRAEACVAREGWAIATSPADADVLLVCGTPGAELGAAVNRLWNQMVAPRARVASGAAADLPQAINAARHALLDDDTQRADAHKRAAGGSDPEPAGSGKMPMDGGHDGPPTNHATHGSMEHGHATHPSTAGGHGSVHVDHESMDHGSMDMSHDSMDHGSMDMSHGHHMHMDMSGPAGIPLAQGEGDRDGLEMDALHVTLGPILPAWPAGLVLRCTLHGDMIAAAEAEVLSAAAEPPLLSTMERGALLIDGAARVVQLAGWDSVGIALRRVRDDLLSPRFDRRLAMSRLQRLERRVRRSRTLRWSLRGVRPSSAAGQAAGPDAHELLLVLLDDAVGAVGGSPERGSASLPAVAASELASAVVGQDLATARLTVATLTPWGLAGMSPAAPAMEATDG
jgi:hypothetical protein